jgi:hypothetical protein
VKIAIAAAIILLFAAANVRLIGLARSSQPACVKGGGAYAAAQPSC